MKSILHQLVSNLSSVFRSRKQVQATENGLGSNPKLFERDRKNPFLMAYISTLLFSFFGFIQENCASVYGESKMSHMKRFKVNALGILTLVLFFGGGTMMGQTNPTAQSLPYSQNFGTSTFSAMPAGMAAWTGGGNKTTQASAETGTPGADAVVTPITSSQTGGNVYGYAVSSNARVYIQESSNATNGTNTIVAAVNTGSSTTLNVSYQLELINGGVTTQDFGLELQYRLGTSGAWSNVTGSVITFGAVTTYTTSTLSYTISGLTASSVYQIRWITWRPNGSGNSKGVGIDNISITGATPVISTTGTLSAVNATYGSASATPTSFNVSGTNIGAGILVTPPAGYEVSLALGSGYAATVTVSGSGTIASTPVYVRLKSTATVAGSPYSGNIVLSSSGATNVNVATVSSAVTAKALTISGITANNKVFDGNTSATLSGTPSLVGIVNGDTVTIGGAPVATFASSAAGTAIPVSVTGYTISGTGASNYTLTQPSLTADITSTPSPAITSTLTASAIYGVASTTYAITASNSPTSFGASGLPAGLTVNTTTGEITGTSTAAPGNYNATISATNGGGTGSATLVYTITAKPLTVSGAVANSKIYDRLPAATISGSTLVGLVGTDVVTVSNTGTFASVTVGTAIAVTSTQTLSGADAAKYTLTVPTGLSADITPKALTLTGASAANKVFDGNNTATITGALSGIVSPDVVTPNFSGTFASTAIGSNIAVTSTTTLSGADAANYTLTQPTGLTASITDQIIYANAFTGTAACPTQGNTPSVVTNATGAALTRSTITCNSTANVFNSTTLNTTASLSATSYIEFSATANTGNVLNVSSVSFFRQASASAPGLLEMRYSTDGFATFTTWGSAPNSPVTGTVATWDFADFTTANGGTVTFRIYPYGTQRADNTGTAAASGTFRVDDVTIYGTVAAFTPPTIASTGTLSALTTTYGTASAATSFNVSGTAMTAGILVTPPTGFEVSLSSGSAYAATVTVGAAGTIASTPVYVRLAASTAVGTYAGNVVLTSLGATAVNVATASSTVNAITVPITGLTANSKIYDGNTNATLSGTPTLTGVLPGDAANVILGGTPVATFASSAVGTGIAVTVTGYTISGSAAGNYTLVQPTGLTADITSSPSPTITSALTASAIYGVAATTYTITASDSPTSYNATGLPSGLVVNTSNGQITGTPTAAPGVYNVTISATNIGGTGSEVLVYTINAKPLTISGATAATKVYDRTNTATISGSTLVGLVGIDVVTVSNTGTFASVNVGTAIAVTSTQTLAGADAAKYTLTIPTGLSADITPKALTIGSAAAQNKNFDGTTTATITGTLTGVIAPDAVTLNLSGNFASSAVGTGIAVTSTSTITGTDAANYSLTQPIGLSANIIAGPTALAAGDIAVIGYNTNGTPDNFAILVLKDLNAGTVFYVNDNEVATAGGTTFTDLAEVEASFTVKAGQTIPAGTVIVLPWGAAAVSTTTYDWSTTSGAGLGNANDEIYIYTAASITANTPTAFIYFAKLGTSTSAVPNGLTLGTTAIAPTAAALRYATTGALYVGCEPALLAAIGNTASNWNATGATAIVNTDWNFTVLSTCSPTITGQATTAVFTTTLGTASASQTFPVAGYNLTANLIATAPTGFEVSADGTSYGATATFIQTSGSANGTLSIRLSAAAAPGTYNSQNIVLSSTGATSVNITTPASGNVVNAAATPTITGTATTAAFTTNVGNASAAQTFPVSGTNLTAALVATAPTGFEVSADGITYGATATFAQTSGSASGTLSIRLSATATAGSYNSQNIVLSSTGATSVNITTPASGNVVFTPTTLNAGDIAIIGYNSNGAPDNFAILILKDLAAGTKFYINDNEVITAGGTAFADLNEGEASFTVKAGQTIPAGTVIVLPWGAGPVSTATYDWSTTSGFGLGSNNEELYIYNATAITSITPTSFIYYTKIGTVSTGLTPAGLTDGVTSINPIGNSVRYATSGALYVGCPLALLQAIGNISGNWNTTGATTLASSDWAFTVEAICKTISTTGTLAALTTTYGTPSSETSFDVSGASLASAVTVTAPAGFEISLTSGGIFSSSLTVGAAGTFGPITVYVRLSGSAAGTYAGNLVLTSTGAPTVTIATASSTVTPITITVAGAVASNKVYDRTVAAAITGATPVGAVVSDGITLVGGGTFNDANVGTAKAVTAALTLAGSNLSSYVLIQPTGLTADITAKALTIAGVSANNKAYDANSSAVLNGTLSGVITPDDVTLIKNASFATASAGTGIAVTSNSFLTGADIANYTLTQPVGLTANITPKALTIDNAVAQNKVFDGNTTAIITGTLGGVISPDDVTLNLSGSFASSAVGNGIAVTSTSTLSGADIANYTLPQPTGLTANITAAPLTPQTITFNPLADAVYGTTVTLTATASSGLPVSYESLNTAVATISGNVLTAVGVGTVTIKATQAGNSTYDTAPFVTQTLNVTPKQLIATATASNKVYDGNDQAVINGTLSGIVGTDAVTLNGTGTFADINVGTAIAVTSTSTLSGANAANYTLAPITGLSADITPKALTIAAGSAIADNKVYDGTTVANITGGDLVGIVGSDEVYILTTAGVFASANVGNAIAVTPTLTIDGAQATNYTLTQPTGLTANITKAALTISGLTGNNKVYNGNTSCYLEWNGSIEWRSGR